MKKSNQNSKANSKNSTFYFLFSTFCICILLFTFYFLLSMPRAEAARLYFEPNEGSFAAGGSFPLEINLDTEGDSINTVGVIMRFPARLLEVQDFWDGGTILSLWVERPAIRIVGDEGEVIFSGIMPGGFKGENGTLLKIFFKLRQEGKGSIYFAEDSETYLNDGKGTKAMLSTSDFRFLVSGEAAEVRLPEISDTVPPEDFKPEIALDPNIFDGKYFLAFAAQDKESGISHYEVYEDLGFRIQDLGKMIKKALYPKSYILNFWSVAESPYLLRDQELKSFIYVKAVDKKGNERTAILPPRYPLKWYEQPLVWGIIILGIIFGYILWKKSKKNLECRI